MTPQRFGNFVIHCSHLTPTGCRDSNEDWQPTHCKDCIYVISFQEIHCKTCYYESKNRNVPPNVATIVQCYHPLALSDPKNKNPCRYYEEVHHDL